MFASNLPIDILNTVLETAKLRTNKAIAVSAMLMPKPYVNISKIIEAIIVINNTNKPIPKALRLLSDIISQALSLNLGESQILNIIITKENINTILFSYDEKFKFSNSKVFLLQTI